MLIVHERILVIVMFILVGCAAPSVAQQPAPMPTRTLPSPVAPTATPGPTATPNAASPTTVRIPPYDQLVHLFDYDLHAPLDLQEQSARVLNGVNVHTISYRSPRGGRVPALLVTPERPGRFAGILLQHGAPEGKEGPLPFAMDLAKAGAVVLLIDAPFARPEHPNHTQPWVFTDQDRVEAIQMIVDLRRGVDLLSARADVEPTRIAYSGVSYGATMGGVLAGVEHRIKAYVLAMGGASLTAELTRVPAQRTYATFRSLPREQQEHWLAAMEPLDAIHYVGHAAPVALFFQAARQDEVVPEAEALRFQQAGSEPKRIKWYDMPHRLSWEAILDQVAWLQEQVGIDAHTFGVGGR